MIYAFVTQQSWPGGGSVHASLYGRSQNLDFLASGGARCERESWNITIENWKSPNLSEPQGTQYLGHSNWTICSPLSQFCPEIFPTFDFHTGEANSFIPQENEKMDFSQPE